jgi:hypothetical protein
LRIGDTTALPSDMGKLPVLKDEFMIRVSVGRKISRLFFNNQVGIGSIILDLLLHSFTIFLTSSAETHVNSIKLCTFGFDLTSQTTGQSVLDSSKAVLIFETFSSKKDENL